MMCEEILLAIGPVEIFIIAAMLVIPVAILFVVIRHGSRAKQDRQKLNKKMDELAEELEKIKQQKHS